MEERHEELIRIGPVDGIDSKIPVFLTAEVPKELLDKFFSEANAAIFECKYPDAQSILVHDLDLSKIDATKSTEPPMPPRIASKPPPFLDGDVVEIREWARKTLDGTLISPRNMIVLDQQTVDDGESCLLISLRGFPKKDVEGDLEKHYQILRSDFESSVVGLKTKETACGGDEQLDADYEGFDGILRNQVRNEWERKAYDGGQ